MKVAIVFSIRDLRNYLLSFDLQRNLLDMTEVKTQVREIFTI